MLAPTPVKPPPGSRPGERPALSDTRKITVEVPEELLARALEASGEGINREPAGDETCAGWLFLPPEPTPPVVVMAHGFAGTRDVALAPFPRVFARRGLAAFVFDDRGFGASGGGPRQLIDPWRQLEDWQAALAFVRGRADLDGSRVALWGSSMGGGHAIIAGARDGEVAAVVAQAPLVDTTREGEAAALGVGAALRLLATAWADLVSALGLRGEHPPRRPRLSPRRGARRRARRRAGRRRRTRPPPLPACCSAPTRPSPRGRPGRRRP